MKPIKPLFLLILFLSLFPLSSYAHDTDIYLASGTGVQPNILIIFDNSQSMNDFVDCQPVSTRVYQKRAKRYGTPKYYWEEYAATIDDAITKIATGGTVCTTVRPNLDTTLGGTGYHDGYTRTSSWGCDRNYLTLATGAWINDNDSTGADVTCSKISIARGVIDDFLSDIENVRVGVMVFNEQSCEKDEYGQVIYTVGGICANYNEHEGGKILSPIDSIDATGKRDALRGAVGALLEGTTYTPLAETLYEAGLYFKGEKLFDPISEPYPTPVLYDCQKNYVIIITDGQSTRDHNAVLNTLPNNGDYDNKGEDPGSYSSGGTDYLNDVAKYIYDNQGISVYTIGFAIDYDLLKRAAEQANGHYYTASDATQLKGAFANVIGDILDKSTSFVAPIVPVSRLERTTAGDKIYLALFKPKQTKMWSGNIKKYGVAQTNGTDYSIGDVLDRNGVKAVDDGTGQFYTGSISYWNATQDGAEVEKGGVGEVLKNRDLDQRKIYTFFKDSGTINLYGNNNNAFTTTNPLITTTVLNLGSGSKDDVINFVYGYDAYGDESADVNATRSWILGSFLHSRPYLINYRTQSVIFAGSNDGMLHAFDDADGTELWAFIPPDVLPNLQYLHGTYNMAFVDGSPKAYVTYNSTNTAVTKAILIFGERRGGKRYYALDVTTPSQPKLLWYISQTERVYQTTTYLTTDYDELWQSWSAPIIGKIACSGSSNCVDGKRVVAFIGGGYYAENQDKGIGTVEDPYTTVADSYGRAIYVVDVLDGSLVKRFSITENANMTYSIPSDIATVDVDGNGKIDRLYVGDVAARVWRFDIQDTNPSNWTGKIVFKSNDDGATTNLRKMFYAPDVTLEVGYDMLIFGTGDREHPNDKTIVNRLYAVKDKNLADTPSNRAYIESDLYNATDNLLQAGDATAKTTALLALNAAKGWRIEFVPSTSGEKCLASPVVFYGVAYFTTFAPSDSSDVTDPCFVGEGTARLYELGYKDAMAVFNLDLTNDGVSAPAYGPSDRSQVIGTAIPSGVIITVIQNRAVAYAGMGGGVIGSREDGAPCLVPPCPPPPPPCGQGGPEICFKNGKVLVPINWKIVF